MTRRRDSASDARRVSRADIEDAVRNVGTGIFIAVLVLVILGSLYSTGVVAQPWETSSPTDRVAENHTLSAGATTSVNVSAAYYWDADPHDETVTNATSGASLTEGTDYEFYTNGTLESLESSGSTKFNITYSYYQMNSFQAMFSTFGTYGTTAFTMLGLGLIAAGGWAAMRYFGGIGGRGSAR